MSPWVAAFPMQYAPDHRFPCFTADLGGANDDPENLEGAPDSLIRTVRLQGIGSWRDETESKVIE